ncbi:NADH dehydrogenase, alpha subcomplex, subunit 6 [Whalleya microplaca]|nr:NADH dehydrogenase, alpha subcomplex, subunit 6 [Whalleya microplaca]
MAVTPTQFAKTTRSSAHWNDAKRRVLAAYREWIRAVRPPPNELHDYALSTSASWIMNAPEIQTMYSIPFPTAVIRTRMRQEFERHRFVNKLPVVDVLLMQNNAEYQETMNFWKQTTHVMSYFNAENFRGAERLPNNFMKGFLEASLNYGIIYMGCSWLIV